VLKSTRFSLIVKPSTALPVAALTLATLHFALELTAQPVPRQVPHRRATQLADGFGMNIDLPREPRMPWTRSWTPIFNAGVKWVRAGQYENSSEQTSWDWVEQTRGHYAVTADVDEAIRSLRENGVSIQIELQYSNPLYGNSRSRPDRVILPPPGIGQNDEPVNPIFLSPKTDEQIEAFLKYARFMVNRYRGSVKHWEFWNEPNIAYWRPQTHNERELVEKAHWYGRVLARVADAVHQTDPQSKVIFGGLAGPDRVFALAALAECAPKIDIFAYHTYPGFGENRMPEDADTLQHAAQFREEILRVPGIRRDLEFWLSEWNVSPKWKNSNDSVQARYVPRFYLYTHAHHMRPFMWTFIPSTDGNEDDLFGIIHGDTKGPDAFQPREALGGFEVTNALFGQTEPDAQPQFELSGFPDRYAKAKLERYAFRDKVSGKHIYAFWLAVYADPADRFTPVQARLALHDPAIRNPILIDLRTGAVRPLQWKSAGVLDVPLKDSAMAVADASYLDWPELPEAPAGLRVVARVNGRAQLQWTGTSTAKRVELQRSLDYGPWQPAGESPAAKSEFSEALNTKGHITWRARAWGEHGASPWANPAWIDTGR
jgi:hypothetical protein